MHWRRPFLLARRGRGNQVGSGGQSSGALEEATARGCLFCAHRFNVGRDYSCSPFIVQGCSGAIMTSSEAAPQTQDNKTQDNKTQRSGKPCPDARLRHLVAALLAAGAGRRARQTRKNRDPTGRIPFPTATATAISHPVSQPFGLLSNLRKIERPLILLNDRCQ